MRTWLLPTKSGGHQHRAQSGSEVRVLVVLVPFGEEALELRAFGLLGFWPWQFWALASAFFELCDLCGCRSD